MKQLLERLELLEGKIVRIGETVEDKKRQLRIQRFMTTLRVTDLTNAGKRGKKVDQFSIYDLDRAEDVDAVDRLTANLLTRVRNYDEARSWADAWVDYYKTSGKRSRPQMEFGQSKGVDVAPAGFEPISIATKKITINADYDSFRVQDVADQYNLSTCIPAFKGGKRDIKVFYRWVLDNKSKLSSMTFSDVVREMGANGIKYHRYCAMD